MAVTMSLYNQTRKLFANEQVNFNNIRAELLSASASFNATHTTKDQVDNGTHSVVTMTIASPCVVTDNAHGLANGATVILTTTGALPTGLTPGTTYYVVNSTTNTYQLSATSGGAAINTSGSQSGTHTAFKQGSYEVSGNGWPANGPTLTTVAVSTVLTNNAALTADNIDVVASGGSIGPATALVLYDSLNGNALLYMDFGGSQSAGATTDFKIVWNASGIILFS